MESKNVSKVRKFYAEKTVFLTGVTGFIGQAMVEKLLHSCPEVETIYVLIRDARGKSGEERLANILKSKLFGRIQQNPDVDILLGKVVPVIGDLTLDDLGLCPELSTKLASTVSVVFHVAANIKLNADMDNLLQTNVKGMKNVLEFSEKIEKLEAFLYVSTAFSNSDLKVIEEKVYPIDVDPNLAIKLYKGLPSSLLDSIEPKLIGKKKNKYTFTKHLAEVLVEEAKSRFPVTIVRPPVVSPAHMEPFPGWLSDFTGFGGCYSGMSKGVIRCLYTNKLGTIDTIPVDLVVNLTLVAAMSCGSACPTPGGLVVYNQSSVEHPFVYKEFYDSMMEAFEEYPPNQILWFPSVVYFRNQLLFAIAKFFFEYLPAVLVDGICIIIGKKPKMLKIYKQVQKLTNATKALQRGNYWLSTENTKALFAALDQVDKQTFNFDIKSVNISDYVQKAIYGVRYFASEEEDKDLPTARKNIQRYKIYYKVAWSLLLLIGITFLGMLVWSVFEIYV